MSGTTTNLGIQEIASNQTQKEVTANTAFDQLDRAMTDTLSTDVSAGGTITPTASTVTFAFNLKFTGTLASAVTFVVPNGKKFYRLHHAGTAHTVTVKVTGQTGVTLNPGDYRLVFCNGTDIVAAESIQELAANKDVANGYAGLDSSAKLKFSEFPDPRVSCLAYDDTASPPTPELATSTHVAFLVKATAGAYHIPAPVSGTDDGKVVEIHSTHAAAHTVTIDLESPPVTPFNATYTVLNFAGSVVGENITIRAYQGNWWVVGTPVGVTLS
ncbi:MAG TPA: hypothetical protein VFA89_20880 [Terriglobales bacterium]|nr:hypothetical protein [Terriglobales bacterium]